MRQDYEMAVSYKYFEEINERIQLAFPQDLADKLSSALYAYVTGGSVMDNFENEIEVNIFLFIREDVIKAIHRSRVARRPRKPVDELDLDSEVVDYEEVEQEQAAVEEEEEHAEEKPKKRGCKKRSKRQVAPYLVNIYRLMDQIELPEEERDPGWFKYVSLLDMREQP
ncbi:MAG: hypothetical protein NC098_05255 [Lachnoclostridium sp.]|nr:hypothetical protein [Lachnoclostridium sp.]